MSNHSAQTTTGNRLIGHSIFVAGFLLMVASLPSGFIWASRGNIALVYVAAFLSWTGYLIAHYGAVGVFVDNVGAPESKQNDDGQADGENKTENSGATLAYVQAIVPEDTTRAIGFVLGITILVLGIAIGAWFVHQEEFLLGMLGSSTFLSGYIIAHYIDSGKLL